MNKSTSLYSLVIFIALGFANIATAAPQPSGPQADGSFRKVILVSDMDTNGDNQTEDNLKDPMELSIAKLSRFLGTTKRRSAF